jgi:hypothetical protein
MDHGGNLPIAWIERDADERGPVLAVRELPDGTPVHGATVVLIFRTRFHMGRPRIAAYAVEYSALHTSDPVESWLSAGWRLTSF